MSECRQNQGIDFFDSIAPKWDSWHDLEFLYTQLSSGLQKFGISPDEHILEVGCGTGNLTKVIIDQLSEQGGVTAVDMSQVMLQTARSKITDKRVTWICEAVEEIAFKENLFDRIICYSVWPHLTDNYRAGSIFKRWLKPGGKLHIWHTISREDVNKIHSEVSPAVKNHLLDPAEQTASLLSTAGYVIEETMDDTNTYLVTARKEQS